jgi:hypothetical protein
MDGNGGAAGAGAHIVGSLKAPLSSPRYSGFW